MAQCQLKFNKKWTLVTKIKCGVLTSVKFYCNGLGLAACLGLSHSLHSLVAMAPQAACCGPPALGATEGLAA